MLNACVDGEKHVYLGFFAKIEKKNPALMGRYRPGENDRFLAQARERNGC